MVFLFYSLFALAPGVLLEMRRKGLGVKGGEEILVGGGVGMEVEILCVHCVGAVVEVGVAVVVLGGGIVGVCGDYLLRV